MEEREQVDDGTNEKSSSKEMRRSLGSREFVDEVVVGGFKLYRRVERVSFIFF